MSVKQPKMLLAVFGAVALLALLSFAAHAGDKYPGWERDSKYDKLYDVSELESFKGKVTEVIDVVPMPDMAPGVALLVKDRDGGELVTVHLGPKGFVDLNQINLRVGDEVKVRGVWAEYEGAEFFMTNKVKTDETTEIKMRRTKDGVPVWDMTPEELAELNQ